MRDRKHQSDSSDVRSALLSHPEAKVVVAHLTKKILYGSDACYRDIPVQIGQVLGAAISRVSMRRVFYENANALFRLTTRR